MGCDGRYAEAYDFSVFWCLNGILAGLDDGGGAGLATLTDSTADFLRDQVARGMPVYNATRKTYGIVTIITQTVLTTTTTWSNGDAYRVALMSSQEVATIEQFLDIAAADIHVALAATGACSCTLADWATEYLRKLNIIDAAVIHNCPCGSAKLSDTVRQGWMRWLDGQFKALVKGELEVCQGATGALFPAFGSVEQSLTDWNAARIVWNAELRED